MSYRHNFLVFFWHALSDFPFGFHVDETLTERGLFFKESSLIGKNLLL